VSSTAAGRSRDVAKAVGVPRTLIERLAREETPVTADTALRLARYFGTTPGFWMGIRAQYDRERAEDELATGLPHRAAARLTPGRPGPTPSRALSRRPR
jgi:addiction module HigA family antidote